MVAFGNVARKLFKKKTVAIAVLVVLAIVAVVVVMRKRKEGWSQWAKQQMQNAADQRAAQVAYNNSSLQSRDRGGNKFRAEQMASACGTSAMPNWYRKQGTTTTCCERWNGSGCTKCRDFYTNAYYDQTQGCTAYMQKKRRP